MTEISNSTEEKIRRTVDRIDTKNNQEHKNVKQQFNTVKDMIELYEISFSKLNFLYVRYTFN